MRKQLGLTSGFHLRLSFFIAMILSIANFAPIVYACLPYCGPCKHWEGPIDTGSCVLNSGAECAEYSDCPGGCQLCSNCQCDGVDAELCIGQCDQCNTETGYCYDDSSLCTVDCDICSSGSCVDPCPAQGKFCDTASDTCVECLDNDDCEEPEPFCSDDHECIGCINCYGWEYVDRNFPDPCPDCDNNQGGCHSSITLISSEYSRFTGGSPPPGEGGLCYNPTKTIQIGSILHCVDYQTDVEEIIGILAGLGGTISTYQDCVSCVATRQPSNCIKCIIDLVQDQIIDEYPCIFINGCEQCYDWDTECSLSLYAETVDWEALEDIDNFICIP